MSAPVLELEHISKRYGAVHANRDVSLQVARQTVHALVGENGAGKSTLMKIAYGHVRPDAGTIRIKGEPSPGHSVAESIRRRVGMVHQHFMLVKPLTVVENIVLGNEPTRRGMLDLATAADELSALSEQFGLEVDPRAPIETLSVGQQQRVEILKALWRQCDVLILDEPTAVLTPHEVSHLFSVLRTLVADGMTIILITHKLDEVLAIADPITVMRKGEIISTMPRQGLTAADIARAMVGRDVLLQVDRGPPSVGATELAVEGLTVLGETGRAAIDDVSLEVRAGEIVGIAGVEGNGQSELLDALVGLRPVEAGTIRLAGADITSRPVYDRYAAGMAHIPEDRHDRALVLDYSVQDNLILGLQREYVTRLAWLDRDRIRERARTLIRQYDIKTPDEDHTVRGLSGGNQQKIVVARELSRPAPRVLICAQPTRGVDIGAIESIHRRMIEARDRGLAVLLISAELSELTALSDRLLVVYRGRVVARFTAEMLAAEGALQDIGQYMTGARHADAPDAPDGSVAS